MRSQSALLLLATFGWLLPLGALIASFDGRRPRYAASLGRAGRSFGALSLLLGATLIMRAAAMALMLILAKLVTAADSWREIAALAFPLVGLVSWWLLDLLQDAIRVCHIHGDDVTLWPSMKSGARLLGARFGAAMMAASWRTLSVLVVFALMLVLGRKLSGGAGDRLYAVIICHQIAIAVHVTMRASWLHWLCGQRNGDQRNAAPA
jgi:hypothetical protein